MLYIIGTDHAYQFGTGVKFGDHRCSDVSQQAFEELLRSLATDVAAQVLAEELNLGALEEQGKSISVVQIVAAALKLPHIFCEPDRTERVALGIREENQIRLTGYPKNMPTEEAVQSLMAESWEKREEEWLKRLEVVKSKSVIFVCGANHISTFIPAAKKQGFECKVIHESWVA